MPTSAITPADVRDFAAAIRSNYSGTSSRAVYAVVAGATDFQRVCAIRTRKGVVEVCLLSYGRRRWERDARAVEIR